MTPEERQLHYDVHFSEQSEGCTTGEIKESTPKSPTKISFKPISKSRFKPISSTRTSIELQNLFWHASLSSDPPPNFSPGANVSPSGYFSLLTLRGAGLVPVLKKALSRSHEKGITQKAWLAFEQAVHIQYEPWDLSWGCGYRNYLMACAALMDQQRQPLYFPLLDSPLPPGVRNLQLTLEEAWKHGYDEEGAQQFNYRIVGTREWIGTADIYVAFTYRGIPAQLVDFSDLRGGVEPLLQWIYNYFAAGDPQPKSTTVGEALRGAQAVTVTDKLPIILQHQGHSRTIVGCERVKNGAINLLTFDPSRKIPHNIRQAGLHYYSPDRHQAASVSKVLHKVMHPVETIKSKKRKSLEPLPDETGPKRKRASDPTTRTAEDVIVIESDSEDEKPSASTTKPAQLDELDPSDVLKVLRIDAKSLK
ncbi:hypothetical protein BN946_scf184798.g68 [Trametes cinnabarina]|uniref:UFSP1/2/DUB catalytic domain-containing protein n=1 Tax=Pycnoporus cinnabarinus TaxID=5643 RepID=A0A060SEE3_PYCCI|nr:hypothetical protein BN946_scf184798.g68 [Trametes cinnabarina]